MATSVNDSLSGYHMEHSASIYGPNSKLMAIEQQSGSIVVMGLKGVKSLFHHTSVTLILPCYNPSTTMFSGFFMSTRYVFTGLFCNIT